jgi:hypothetical protein
MRRLSHFKFLGAAAALAFLAGCSGGGSALLAPKPASVQSESHRVPLVLKLLGARSPNSVTLHRYKSFDTCPADGPIKYVSDYNNNVVDLYVGKFAGQTPCGRLTSGINSPWGLYVEPVSHDLYVANDGAKNILVFHRGQTKAYNTYTDPTAQDPVDVTVARDGTVIASNLVQINFNENGSISTWIGGPNGGKFVGNFATANGGEGQFVTVQKDGTVFFDDLIGNTANGALFSLSCPAGACGSQTQVTGVSFNLPGGLESNDNDDLLANDGLGFADTFKLPNPNPKTFPVAGIPTGMAINRLDHHWFVADGLNNNAAEYLYPGGKLVGKVQGNPDGGTFGIAVDPGHTR